MSGAEERLANDRRSELWGEHRSRYRFASHYVAGQRVLDVASGAGFGLAMLLSAGALPLGVDYDASALAQARRLEPSARLVRGDATCLPLKAQAFDLVTSFETIEHVADAAALVSELRRVLKPGGRLVLSTPNREFGPSHRHTGNPFHIREFAPAELRELLSKAFDEVRLYGQRPSATYRYVPYLMVEADNTPAAILWKLQAHLPFAVKNGLALRLGGRPFYPDENEYAFQLEACDGAHALLAVAR